MGLSGCGGGLALGDGAGAGGADFERSGSSAAVDGRGLLYAAGKDDCCKDEKRIMTVRELKQILQDIPDGYEVVASWVEDGPGIGTYLRFGVQLAGVRAQANVVQLVLAERKGI